MWQSRQARGVAWGKRERSGPRRDRSFRPFESTYVAVRVTVVLAAFGLKMNTEPPTGMV